jgi:uncharacterized membrane protein YqiK
LVGVTVLVGVEVLVGVLVGVEVLVGVLVGVFVGVFVGVGVGVGAGPTWIVIVSDGKLKMYVPASTPNPAKEFELYVVEACNGSPETYPS